MPVVLEDGEAKLLPKLHIEMTHGATKTIVPFDQLADIDLIYPEQKNDDQSVDYLATFQDEWRSQSIQATEYLLNDRVTDLSQRNISTERVTKLMQAEASELCAQLMADENFLTEHMLEAGKLTEHSTLTTTVNGRRCLTTLLSMPSQNCTVRRYPDSGDLDYGSSQQMTAHKQTCL